MAKVQQKSEKITAFGGIFFVLDKFDSILSSVIDSHLGLRSKLIGYQYSEIIRAVFSVFWHNNITTKIAKLQIQKGRVHHKTFVFSSARGLRNYA